MNIRRFLLASSLIVLMMVFTNGVLAIRSTVDKINISHNNRMGINNEQAQATKDDASHNESAVTYERPVNILMLGLDEYDERSDVILLINFHPEDGAINLLSIARDTKVKYKNRDVKINSLIGYGGEELIVSRVSEITGLDIPFYVTANFKGFKKTIDVLGGVEFDVPIDMDYDDPEQNLHIHLKKGRQVLNGDAAEQFVRFRKSNVPGHGYDDGDIGRIRAQQKFIKALIEQKLKVKFIAKAGDIFNIINKYVKTNIQIDDITYYLRYADKIQYNKINSYTIPGEPAYQDQTWYYIYNQQQTTELINNYFN